MRLALSGLMVIALLAWTVGCNNTGSSGGPGGKGGPTEKITGKNRGQKGIPVPSGERQQTPPVVK